jgi:superfamily II DNA or RNA helicase
MTIQLRPYQQEALNSIREYSSKGINKQLVVLPTGAGKTVVFTNLPQSLENSLPMLILAHREELLVQAKDKLSWSNPQLTVEIEQAGNYATHCDVVVASVPTLGRDGSERISRFPRDYFRTIVIDEAHHAAAPTYRRILDYFQNTFTIGVTATPQRSDNTRLTDVFDEIVYYKTILDLIEEGWLSRLVGYRIATNTDISEVQTREGDYVSYQLEDTINTPQRNSIIVSSYLEICGSSKAIAFCSGVQHAHDLAASFAESSVTSEVIIGSTPSEERQQILKRFSSGKTKVLVNVGVLTEGFDEPSIEAIILARPTRSTLLYTQIVGRGTRLFEGKEHCKILDFADTTKGKKPLGLPSLLGLPPDFDLCGQDLVEVAKKYKDLEEFCPGEAVRVLNPEDIELAYKRIDLFMPPPANEIVQQYSRFVWAEISDDVYHLGLNGSESIRIQKDTLGRWVVTHRVKFSGSEIVSKTLGYPADMRDAFARSDTWIMQRYDTKLIDSTATWRSDSPTDAQKRTLKRIGVPVTSDMTKGIASQIIGKYYENNPKPQWLQNKINYNKGRW